MILSQTIKKLAYRLILAYSYTPEAIKDVLELFKESLNKEDNFVDFKDWEKTPFAFSESYLTHFKSKLEQLSSKHKLHLNLSQFLTGGLEKGEASIPYAISQFFSSAGVLKQYFEVNMFKKDIKEEEKSTLESLKNKLKEFLDMPYTNLQLPHIEELTTGSKNYEGAKVKILTYINYLIKIFDINLTPTEAELLKTKF